MKVGLNEMHNKKKQSEKKIREEERNLRRYREEKRRKGRGGMELQRPSGRERGKGEEEEKKDALRKLRLIESYAKYRNLKNLPLTGLCGRWFICLRPPPLLLF